MILSRTSGVGATIPFTKASAKVGSPPFPGHSAFAPGAALAAPYLPSFAILVGIDPAGGKLSFYDQGTQSPWVLIGATLPPSHLTPLYNRNRFVADPQP